MNTTRRGFFGLLTGALASVPALSRLTLVAPVVAPAASVYTPVELWVSMPIKVCPWLTDETGWFIDSKGTVQCSEQLFSQVKSHAD
jgi:hypothetical protein